MNDMLSDTDRKALRQFEAKLDAEYDKQLDALERVFRKKGPPADESEELDDRDLGRPGQ